MNRRHTDLPDHLPETREATLEVLVNTYRDLRDLGSENFRRYRKRAYFAFAFLAVTNGIALYLTIHNAKVANRNLAASVRQVTVDNCISSNEFRRAIRVFVNRSVPAGRGDALRELAARSFGPRDCRELARQIK